MLEIHSARLLSVLLYFIYLIYYYLTCGIQHFVFLANVGAFIICQKNGRGVLCGGATIIVLGSNRELDRLSKSVSPLGGSLE